MNKQVLHRLVAVACVVASSLTHVRAQGVSEIDHSRRVSQAKSACAPYQGRKLSLVIQHKPGGGFDLMARALEPLLSSHSGMSVAVSSITGGHGILAIRTVVNAKSDRPVVGLIDLGSFATQLVSDQAGLSLSSLAGLGVMATDHTVWITRQPLVWSPPDTGVYTSTSTTSPYVRLGIPGQLLGLKLKPIFGFEGTNQAWLALLRGDVDIVTMSDQSASRNLAAGATATVGLILSDRPHPEFPGVPYLAGVGGLVDARTKALAPNERKRLMDLGALSVMLSEQARTLVASAKLEPAVLKCLRHATQAALFDPALAEVAERQKFGLSPEKPEAAQEKMQKVARALSDNRDYLRSIAAAWKEGN